ncbi:MULTISPECIES: hypothetical protein [unclassified Nocardia]|uniref:hypothetical protein n=1 Tax=unclassified Nocardia TaxID=2637762 RepID=UPI00278C6AEC|nr:MULTISPECIES: hypothetical protein [unclassified Nocardia]
MTDQLANTKAFLTDALAVVQAKDRWENYDSNTVANRLQREAGRLYQAIRVDDPAYVLGGTPTEATTTAAVRAYTSALVAKGPIVRDYAAYGDLEPSQAVIFGDGGILPYGNPGFVGDLVKAVQLDVPGWTP